MTPDLSAIQKRADAASPGPWQQDLLGGGKGHPNDFSLRQSGPDKELGKNHLATISHHSGNARANSEFIAHAREDIPALIAAVKELAEALRDVEKDHNGTEWIGDLLEKYGLDKR